MRKPWGFGSTGRHFLAIILSLSIGIGGVTAVYSVVRSTPLLGSWLGPGSLVWFMVEDRSLGLRTTPRASSIEVWRASLDSFDEIAGLALEDGAVRTDLGAHRIRIGVVDPGFFDLLGEGLVAGRVFDADDLRQARDVALVKVGLARNLFGDPQSALGAKIVVDGRPLTVQGVVPADFGRGLLPGEAVDVFRPLEPERRGNLFALGRLRSGVTVGQGQAELDAREPLLGDESVEGDEVHWILHRPVEMLSSNARRMLEIGLVAGLLLIVVTASNVSHLLAAHAEAQRKEIAARWAVGATRLALLRWRAGRALLAALVSVGLGALLAAGGLEVVSSIAPADFHFLKDATVNVGALAFAVVLSFGVITMSALPSLFRHAGRLASDLHEQPRLGTRSSSLGRLLGHVHLVTVVAVAAALIIVSIQVFRTTMHLKRLDLGFQVEGLVAADVTLPEGKLRSPEERKSFFSRLTERVAALDTIESVVLATPGPPEAGFFMGALQFGSGEAHGDLPPGVGAAYVEPGYFRVVGQKVLAGRGFTEEDLRDGPPSIVVSATTAKYFGSDPREAVGNFVLLDGQRRTVVGVVADTRSPGSPRPFGASLIYWPLRRHDNEMTMLLRAPDSIQPVLREIATGIDPDALVETQPLENRVADAMAGIRFLLTLFALLAFLVFGLALLGAYSLMSSSVARHAPQIALRMALGASREAARSWTLRRGLVRCLVGVILGVAVSYPLCMLLESQLTGIEAEALGPRLVAAIVVLATTFVATWLPTVRASRIDPAAILKI